MRRGIYGTEVTRPPPVHTMFRHGSPRRRDFRSNTSGLEGGTNPFLDQNFSSPSSANGTVEVLYIRLQRHRTLESQSLQFRNGVDRLLERIYTIRKFVKSFYPLWKERLLTRPYIALKPGWNLPTLDIRLSGVCMGTGRLFKSHKPFCGSERSCEAI